VTGPSLAGRRVVVEVPGTIANLGAGYDCLGIAVGITLQVTVEVGAAAGAATEVVVEGEGSGEISAGRGNRVLEALEASIAERRIERSSVAGLRITMRNEIPLARGLGSSGAATVAGLICGDVLAGVSMDGPDADEWRARLLDRATALEGHSDNVAPALLGGFVASLAPRAFRFDAPKELRIVLLVPELRLSTPRMRTLLPDSVPRSDAVANLARVALGVAGVASGDWSVLARLTEDRLHEPYRAAVYTQLPLILEAGRAAGALGACLAGGGSTVAAFTLGSEADAAHIGERMLAAATAHDLPAIVRHTAPRNEGARVLEA
jgi:homoserine kinase